MSIYEYREQMSKKGFTIKCFLFYRHPKLSTYINCYFLFSLYI